LFARAWWFGKIFHSVLAGLAAACEAEAQARKSGGERGLRLRNVPSLDLDPNFIPLGLGAQDTEALPKHLIS